MIWLLGVRVEIASQRVHRWNNTRYTCRVLRVIQCRHLVLLIDYALAYVLAERTAVLTCNTDTSCSIIPHPSLSSSYLRNLRDLSTVILSIGFRYSRANTIISWVEFQRVTTSRGISFGFMLWASQIRRHAGRAIIVE